MTPLIAQRNNPDLVIALVASGYRKPRAISREIPAVLTVAGVRVHPPKLLLTASDGVEGSKYELLQVWRSFRHDTEASSTNRTGVGVIPWLGEHYRLR